MDSKFLHWCPLYFFPRCLDKAAVVVENESKPEDFSNPWKLCTVTQVEEFKILIRMFPIWATGIVFSAVYAQMSSMFVEQGAMMDTSIGSFKIPAASLSTFDVISVIFWVPVYDRILVPIAQKLTGKERGFSELQRMGIGLFLSVFCMSAAAIVEIWRLNLAQSLGLVDEPVPVPISIFWQVPQYFLLGAAEVFTFIGQLEFFYDQSPDAMRSLCSAFSLLTTSLGNYLSSFILTVVTSLSTRGGNIGWIPDNLNKGHLDYFFWLLAGLSLVNLVIYIFCSKKYKSKKATWDEMIYPLHARLYWKLRSIEEQDYCLYMHFIHWLTLRVCIKHQTVFRYLKFLKKLVRSFFSDALCTELFVLWQSGGYIKWFCLYEF